MRAWNYLKENKVIFKILCDKGQGVLSAEVGKTFCYALKNIVCEKWGDQGVF